MSFRHILALLCVFALSTQVHAYRLTDDDVEVVDGVIVKCTYDLVLHASIIDIPETLDGQTVTGIGNAPFTSSGKVKQLTLPATLKTIGDYAFYNHDLTTVIIPEGMVSIGNYAFSGNVIQNLSLPQSLEHIGFNAFDNNMLTKVEFGSKLKTVGNAAFSNNQITTLKFPATMERIGISAFENNELRSVIIPKGVNTIEERSFNNNKITNLTLSDSVSTISSEAFSNNELSDLVLPNSVTYIGVHAFSNNQLSGITFSNGLHGIDGNAFSNNKLVNLNLPQSLKEIGPSAFSQNELTTLMLPFDIDKIGAFAFSYNKIKRLTIPNDPIIMESAFAFNEITDLKFSNKVPDLAEYVFSYNKIATITFPTSMDTIPIGTFYNNSLSEVTLPDDMSMIGEYAFANNVQLSKVNFNQGLARIKKNAFLKCDLLNLDLPASLVFIGQWAFDQNSRLPKFNLPNSIQGNAWINYEGNRLANGAEVTNFESSYVLEVPYTLTDEDVLIDDNGLLFACPYFLDGAHVGSAIIIPETLQGKTVKGIASQVFARRGLVDVQFPNTLETIHSRAFIDNALYQLNVSDSVHEIGASAFELNYIKDLNFGEGSTLSKISAGAFLNNKIKKLEIPNTVQLIGKAAFSTNDLDEVIFDQVSSLRRIEETAFYENPGLDHITLPKSLVEGYEYVGWIDSEETKMVDNLRVKNFMSYYQILIQYTLSDDDVVVEDGVIISCSYDFVANIITIPDTLDGQKIIGIADGGVFSNKGMIEVNLPSKLKHIGVNAFNGNKLIDLTLPESMQLVASGAFSNNNIKQLNIPKGVTEIGELAFDGNKIANLTMQQDGHLKTIGDHAFSNNRIANELILPDSVELVESDAFSSNQITKLSIGKNSQLTRVDDYAFAFNQIEGEVYMPAKLQRIGTGAFRNNKIETLLFLDANQLSSIGKFAFSYNLISNELAIPQGVVIIEEGVFRGNQLRKVNLHPKIIEINRGAFADNDPSLAVSPLHEPPTIEFVTWFIRWKDDYDNSYYPGYVIKNYENFYKAVIDQYLRVKFRVVDDNGIPVEGATVQFSDSTMITDPLGVDSIAPVLRGIHNYTVSAPGCRPVSGQSNVQDDIVVDITLIRNYTINFDIADRLGKAIVKAEIAVNGNSLWSDSTGRATLVLPDGNYPFRVSHNGYRPMDTLVSVMDKDTSISVVLDPSVVFYYPNKGVGELLADTSKGSSYLPIDNTFTREGYGFFSWNTKADRSGIKILPDTAMDLPIGDLDLHAIWKPIDYPIHYDAKGGVNPVGNPLSYNIESDTVFLQPSEKTGLYFAAWFDQDSTRVRYIPPGSKGDVNVWAYYTPEPTFFIDYFNLENAEHHNQTTYTQFDLPLVFSNASKRGYPFLGWYRSMNFANQMARVPKGSKVDIALYANWGPAIDYKIVYQLDGGINDATNPASFTIESDRIVFKPATKRGYTFLGWYADSAFTTEIKAIPGKSIGDTILYAKYEIITYSITYELNGGINHTDNPNSYTVDDAFIDLKEGRRDSTIFMGWFSDSLLTQRVESIPQGSIGDVKLFADWQYAFTVYFNITTDGATPTKGVNIIIDHKDTLQTDSTGLQSAYLPDKKRYGYRIELDGIEIKSGEIGLFGSDAYIHAAIVDAYMRWGDVIFCDNGKGLWKTFEWYNPSGFLGGEQFYHQEGGMANGTYQLVVTSQSGLQFSWTKAYRNHAFEMVLFPNPIPKRAVLNLHVTNIELGTSRYELRVYGMGGNVLDIIQVSNEKNEINLSDKYSSGIYRAVLFKDGAMVSSQQIIVY